MEKKSKKFPPHDKLREKAIIDALLSGKNELAEVLGVNFIDTMDRKLGVFVDNARAFLFQRGAEEHEVIEVITKLEELLESAKLDIHSPGLQGDLDELVDHVLLFLPIEFNEDERLRKIASSIITIRAKMRLGKIKEELKKNDKEDT